MSWLSSLSVTVVTYVYCRCMALEGLPGRGLWEGPCIPYFLYWSFNIGTFFNLNSPNTYFTSLCICIAEIYFLCTVNRLYSFEGNVL